MGLAVFYLADLGEPPLDGDAGVMPGLGARPSAQQLADAGVARDPGGADAMPGPGARPGAQPTGPGVAGEPGGADAMPAPGARPGAQPIAPGVAGEPGGADVMPGLGARPSAQQVADAGVADELGGADALAGPAAAPGVAAEPGGGGSSSPPSSEGGGAELVLGGAEGRHAAVVRRITPGERLRLTDGAGNFAEGSVTQASKSGVTVAVDRRGSVPKPTPRLVVVQALPKGERAELAVEMLTEVGVDLIVPWNAERSQFRANPERVEKTLTKWRSWAFEASKQSRRSWFCEVAPVASTAEVVQLVKTAGLAAVLHEEAKTPLATMNPPVTGDVVIVVGPEGGISAAELEAFATEPVLLGDTVLRTSTAGVAAASVLLANSRWRTTA
ncbi:16S rRNA (uracil(1498)-N(3))-methyltransferase [Kribbella italica]|uniref:Ribosomal RNA small subunit methyltransferase E n=1 Tax=Kribbella italica TaxID=1540520 RepID=A0A7W9MSB2_9ACTN|nr:16S rRNA (uracil(1498)-N(3))-methyltransferase [Kribbella italica]MBB5833718.1 RsmE family RNA methyltransferase [Kribbella italica]